MVHIPVENLRSDISVRFDGEPGIDLGGVKRDFFN